MIRSALRRALDLVALVFLTLGLAGSLPTSAGGPVAPPPASDLPLLPNLKGSLPVPALWSAWKTKFVSPEGRVMDDLNGNVSHSESQGYGLLLALAADDGDTFRRIWTWTRGNLYLRKDGLASWRWQPGPAPNVRDPNNASDGDLLVAWALVEAGEAWNDQALSLAGRRIARALFAEAVTTTRRGPTLLPAVGGFRQGDRKDGPVVNPSYWVYPALARLDRVLPDLDWVGLARTGEKIGVEATENAAHLPPDWVSLGGETARAADGFPPIFSYDAVRVPLYMAWAGGFRRERLAPYLARWNAGPQTKMHIVDVVSGRDLEPFVDGGYHAVAALVACALEGTRFPDELRRPDVDHYYPSTLRALALVAVNTRHPTCW